MSDCGLDWEWTRTEFRKALSACATAATDVDFSEGEGLFWELKGCSLLLLNFRDRLSLKQQGDLSDLAAACDIDHSEFRGDPEWDDYYARRCIEDAIKRVREFPPLFEGI